MTQPFILGRGEASQQSLRCSPCNPAILPGGEASQQSLGCSPCDPVILPGGEVSQQSVGCSPCDPAILLGGEASQQSLPTVVTAALIPSMAVEYHLAVKRNELWIQATSSSTIKGLAQMEDARQSTETLLLTDGRQ